MGRLRHILTPITLAVAACLWHGCNTSGCIENRSSIPKAGFYSSSTGKPISVDSLTITGVGKAGGTPLYDGSTPLSTVYLPFRSTEQSTAWDLSARVAVAIDDSTRLWVTVSDTLTFDYTSTPYFASDECGVIYRYDIRHMRYTTHLIDSVVITDSLITNLDIERVKVYFRTQQPDPQP